MKLAQWLSANNIRPSDFAQKLGVSPSTVTRLVNGERKPSGELMAKICSVTKGDVELDDWFPRRELKKASA